MSHPVKVTIITVCYRAESAIGRTMQSVLCQDYPCLEYIIKDGVSTDHTNELIRERYTDFDKKGICLRHIIEPDQGIYDAMNRAAAEAQGEWVIFLNAGDSFYGSDVISRTLAGRQDSKADVIYGDTVENDNGFLSIRKGDMERVRKRMPFGHQSCLIRTETMRRFPYDPSFQISADYHMVLRLYLAGGKFEYCGEKIAVFSMDGISSTDFVNLVRERERARLACGIGDGYRSWHYRLQYMEARVKMFLQRVCPPGVLGWLRRFYLRYIKKNQPFRDERAMCNETA